MAIHILDQLGGNKIVADALNVSPGAVANWRLPSRNIPWRFRHAIARLAAERGVTLPNDFWTINQGEAA